MTISSVDNILKIEISIFDNMAGGDSVNSKVNSKRKCVFRDFRYTECDAFAGYLHNMSRKGWHFKEWRMGLVFEKGEPADIYYRVEVFPKGTEMDTKPEMPAEEYAEYCRAAGWEFLDGKRKFCIFRRNDQGAVPIVTEEERFDNVRKAEWRLLGSEMLIPLFVTVSLGLRMLGLVLMEQGFSISELSNAEWFVILTVILMMVMRLAQCSGLLIWQSRGKKKLLSGRRIFYGRKYWNMLWDILCAMLLLGIFFLLCQEGMTALTVYVLCMGVLLFGLMAAIAHFRLSRGENWAFLIGGGLLIIWLVTSIWGLWLILT